jgi:hypothetical protein
MHLSFRSQNVPVPPKPRYARVPQGVEVPQQGTLWAEGGRAGPSLPTGRMCLLGCGARCMGVCRQGHQPPLDGVEGSMVTVHLLHLDVLHLQVVSNECHGVICTGFIPQPVTSYITYTQERQRRLLSEEP